MKKEMGIRIEVVPPISIDVPQGCCMQYWFFLQRNVYMIKNRKLLRILEIPEDNPLSSDAWKQVLALCKYNQDEFRANAIDILLEGFNTIKTEEKRFILHNTHITSILLRLSFSKRIEPLLKEIALFFLNELDDPYTTQGICRQVMERRIGDEDFRAMFRESEYLIKKRAGINLGKI